MEAITFKTESGNSYLYSPARKVVIPIPQHADEGLLSDNFSNNDFLVILEKEGYLENFDSDYSVRISAKDIENSITLIPQHYYKIFFLST